MRSQHRADQRGRQQRRHERVGRSGDQRLNCGQMQPAHGRAVRQARPSVRGVALPAKMVSGSYAVALQQIERHIELPPRGMQRERSQQTRNAIGDAGMRGEIVSIAGSLPSLRMRAAIAISADDVLRHSRRARSSDAHRDRRRDRTTARIDEVGEHPRRQPIAHDSVEQRRRHRIGPHFAAATAGEDVAPPLQPDFARHRLARLLAHARDLDVEGIEREQRPAISWPARTAWRGSGPCPPRAPAPRNGERGPTWRAARSLHRDQSRGDAAAFAQQDVVGRDRRARPRSLRHRDLSAWKRNRSASGMIQGSRPLPIRNRPISAAAANTGASAASSISLGLRRPATPRFRSAGTSSEPRCDMPAKRKPPLP